MLMPPHSLPRVAQPPQNSGVDALLLPAWPVALQRLARVAVLLLLALGLLWWGASALAWWRGQASGGQWALHTLLALAASSAPLAWLRADVRSRSRSRGRGRRQVVPPALALIWQAPRSRGGAGNRGFFDEDVTDEARAWAASPWRDLDGRPAEVSVLFDLGVALLLRVRMPGVAASLHWVPDASLKGPWRWRLMQTRWQAPTAGGVSHVREARRAVQHRRAA